MNRADGWALRLEPYNFDVEYVRGEENIADPFSRLYAHGAKPIAFENDHEPHVLCFVNPQVNILERLLAENSITMEEIIQHSENCSELTSLKNAIQSGNWNSKMDEYKAFESEYFIHKNYCGAQEN